VLDGRWQWGTGVMHADWALLGGIVEDTGELRMFAVPIDEVDVIDTWDATGMTGTGSNDMQVRGLHVPARRAVLIPEMFIGRTAGGMEHEGAMFRMPMMPILCLAAGTPAIGAAKGALKAFCDRAGSRVMYGSNEIQANVQGTHIRVGEARARIEVAELIARQVAAEAERWGETDAICGTEDRVRLRVRMAYVVRLCRDVVRDLFEVSGASAQLASQSIQRIHRDVHTIASHTVFDLDYIGEQYGRLTFGLEPSRAV
jgi:alkylation response protein AidB-like acyl-CoA dehydrogenase